METIQEDQSSKSHIDTKSWTEREMSIGDFTNQQPESSEPNGLKARSPGIELNMLVSYYKINNLGTSIYHDPIGRYLAKVEDHVTPLQPNPLVNNQYMGCDRDLYIMIGCKKNGPDGVSCFEKDRRTRVE